MQNTGLKRGQKNRNSTPYYDETDTTGKINLGKDIVEPKERKDCGCCNN